MTVRGRASAMALARAGILLSAFFLVSRVLGYVRVVVLAETYGIGAELDLQDDLPVIVGVFRGTPADRAGLLRGDVIVSVDGESTEGKPLDAVIVQTF